MEDLDFFDMIYQGFTKTTHAEDAYWGFEPYEEAAEPGQNWGDIFVQGADFRQTIAVDVEEADAAFITAVHGCFPDLHRALLQWHDEAETKDRERDNTEVKYAELVEDYEKVAADLRAARQGQQRRDNLVEEDWHGKATSTDADSL